MQKKKNTEVRARSADPWPRARRHQNHTVRYSIPKKTKNTFSENQTCFGEKVNTLIHGGSSGQAAKFKSFVYRSSTFEVFTQFYFLLCMRSICVFFIVKTRFPLCHCKHSYKGIWDCPTFCWALFLLGGHHLCLLQKRLFGKTGSCLDEQIEIWEK